MYYYDANGVIRGEIPVLYYRSHRLLFDNDGIMWFSASTKHFVGMNRLGKLVKIINLGDQYILHHDYALDSDGNTLSGKACAFAPVNPASASYRLLLRVVCTDGSVFAREIGVKPENIKISSPRNVIITVDGIEIPDKGTPGDIGGIDAVVDGWEEGEIDLSPSLGAPS